MRQRPTPSPKQLRRAIADLDSMSLGQPAPERLRLALSALASWLRDNSWLRDQSQGTPPDLRWP